MAKKKKTKKIKKRKKKPAKRKVSVKKKKVLKKRISPKKKAFKKKKVSVKRKKKVFVKPKKKVKILVKKSRIKHFSPKKPIKIEPIKEEEDTQDKSYIFDATVHRTKIRIIGIGGGGGTIVSEIASRVKRADFYLANTDVRSLKKHSKGIKTFQFGKDITHGLGTGTNVELGELAAQADKEDIKNILEGQDLSIIIACLGGGSGSGAAPIFAKISRSLNNLTYGIFTLPFEFEGEKKMETALTALEKIKPFLNVYTVIPNERVFQFIDKNTPLRDAFSAINKALAENLEGLIETIYLPGLINIDFADLKTILSGRGRLAYLNTLDMPESEQEGFADKLTSSPFYPYTAKGAKGILFNITGGKDIQLSDVSKISDAISQSANKDAKIIFGINQNSKSQDAVRVTILAAGCSSKVFPSPKVEPKEEFPEEDMKKVKVKKHNKKPLKKTVVSPKKKKIKVVLVNENTPVEKVNYPRIRKKTALQVKKEVEKQEKDILANEETWDIPAILRRKS